MSREVADTNRLDARECHCVVVFDRASGDANCAHQDACFIHYGKTAREGGESLVRMLDSKERGAWAIGFAKQNAEAGFALAGELAKAKDIKEEIMSMQSRYAQTQMQSYALQAQELGRLMTEAVQGMQSRA